MSIIGTWKFNKILTNTLGTDYFADLSFRCADVICQGLIISDHHGELTLFYGCESLGMDISVYEFTSSLWEDEKYRTIEILSEYEDQTFTTWLKTNAYAIPENTIAKKLTQIAENEPKVFDAGKKAEYDAFWDAFQMEGKREDYYYVFAGYGWNGDNFRPKYDIKGTRFSSAFGYTAKLNIDLSEHLKNLGKCLDTSKATDVVYMFAYSNVTAVPHIDMSSITKSPTQMFNACSALTRIEKLTFPEGFTNYPTNMFQNCKVLTDIEAEGTISGSLNFQWSSLSIESMKSIISHLQPYTGTNNDGVYTIKFSDACWNALHEDSISPDGKNNWKYYVNTVLGWAT